MRSYRIALIRHGRTSANDEQVYIGKTDLPLSERGKAELGFMRESFTYPRPERVYCSPLERALQSSEALFPETDITVVDDLREMDFGIFEGIKLDDAVKLDTYKKWLKGGLDNPPPNGESLREMLMRCYSSMNAIILDMMRQDIHNAAVMTHGGIISNILSCMGLPKAEPMNYLCSFGEGWLISVNAMLWQNGGTFEIIGKIPEDIDDTEDEDFADDT